MTFFSRFRNANGYTKMERWHLMRTFSGIKSRCKSHKNYAGRGIKCLITLEELHSLWIRDKGYLLYSPSIDRVDPKGNYEFGNCRFIELGENCAKGNRPPLSTEESMKYINNSTETDMVFLSCQQCK